MTKKRHNIRERKCSNCGKTFVVLSKKDILSVLKYGVCEKCYQLNPDKYNKNK